MLKIANMLEMHKKNGVIDSTFSSRLRIGMGFCHESITKKMIENADSMATALTAEVITTLEREGVQLPAHK